MEFAVGEDGGKFSFPIFLDLRGERNGLASLCFGRFRPGELESTEFRGLMELPSRGSRLIEEGEPWVSMKDFVSVVVHGVEGDSSEVRRDLC
jgi:hypothetical protein